MTWSWESMQAQEVCEQDCSICRAIPWAFTISRTTHSTRVPARAEQRPDDWWSALVGAVGGCLATAGQDAKRVIGLSVDAPCNILLVDGDGRPLTNSLIWMDLRGAEAARRLTETHDPVLHYCGEDVPAEWPLPKALWLKENDPALWDRAGYLVEQIAWLTWRLTGEWVIPLNTAAAKWHYRARDDGSVSRRLAHGAASGGRSGGVAG